jgi:uncharacterized membrane protein
MKLGAIRKNISENLFKGALILLPFFISFYFIIWIAELFNKSFSQTFRLFGIDKDYPFGIGILVGLSLLYILGKTSEIFLAKHIKMWLERIIKSIPVLGSIFSSIRELSNFFKKTGTTPQGKAVILTFENPNFKIAGFLTKTDLHTLPTDDKLDDLVAVYIPLAYMVGGGFTVFVNKNNVKALDLPFDKAMQASLSAWMINFESNK